MQGTTVLLRRKDQKIARITEKIGKQKKRVFFIIGKFYKSLKLITLEMGLPAVKIYKIQAEKLDPLRKACSANTTYTPKANETIQPGDRTLVYCAVKLFANWVVR